MTRNSALCFVVVLVVGIGDGDFLILDALVGEGGDADVGGLGAVLGNLGGDGLGHVEAVHDETGVFLLLTVFLDGFFHFNPAHAVGGVELVEVLDDAVDVGGIVLARLRVGEVLTQVGVDEGAGVHVGDFGSGDLETEFGGLLAEEGFVDEVLPDLFADLALDLGGDLGGLLLHLVVVFHLLDEFVETLVGHDGAVDLTHVGNAAVVFRQVTGDECQNGDTHDSHGYPGVLSNSSDNCHCVVFVFYYYLFLFSLFLSVQKYKELFLWKNFFYPTACLQFVKHMESVGNKCKDSVPKGRFCGCGRGWRGCREFKFGR